MRDYLEERGYFTSDYAVEENASSFTINHQLPADLQGGLGSHEFLIPS